MIKYNNTYDLDDPKTTLIHRDIIKAKPFLKNIYIEWYEYFKARCQTVPEGKLLEIGSGGGFIKEVFSEVITSDIMPLENCEMTFSAEQMPFKNEELSAIMMINVLHHIPHNEKFLKEAQRTLKKGGKVLMVEPANSLFGRFIYRNFHHEPFEPKATKWDIDSTGPLSGANGALPWIIFERDRNKFNKLFPSLRVQKIEYIMPFRYLVSGGVSRRTLVPDWSYGIIKSIEKLLTPFKKQLGMFMKIEVQKI